MAHDHRHTFATHCGFMKIPRFVSDGILGHIDASMAAVYHHYDFGEERLNCVERWADRIEAALADNVVEMKSTKKRA